MAVDFIVSVVRKISDEIKNKMECVYNMALVKIEDHADDTQTDKKDIEREASEYIQKISALY